MKSTILVLHTPAQLEQASNLVDLLEASLPLADGAIKCSSLPGYAWSDGDSGVVPIADAGAAIALLDEPALLDAQLLCDLGAAWATGRRVAVVVDRAELRALLPLQLQGGQVIERADRAALASLVEDIAFDLGIDPRLGREANRLIEVISVPPPAPPASARPGSASSKPAAARASARPAVEAKKPSPVPATSPPGRAASKPSPAREASRAELAAASLGPPMVRPARTGAPAAADYEAIETVPPPPHAPSVAKPSREDTTVEQLELEDDDAPEPLRAAPAARPSQPTVRLRCETALEAGRVLGESAFHRDEGSPGGSELDGEFAQFIEAIGGRYADLKRLDDVELWLAATDNLLENLPQSARVVAEWYEVGFQYATLKCIAEQGMPDSPEERSIYLEMWERSLGQLRDSARVAGLPGHELRRVQALLENVIGPVEYRDYTNLAGSLRELRELARNADRPANRYARLAN